MVKYWFINGDFTKERSRKIGASDVPALIPNPDNPTESLAGYGRTPITVWQEKTGRKKRDFAGLPAEMGHFLETKALELFIRETHDIDIAKKFLNKKVAFELDKKTNDPRLWQYGKYRHNTQYYNNIGGSGMIAHPDCIYNGVLGEYLIEAKSANYWATKRPTDSKTKGYDFKLESWQGIPLKHYMQIQFQLALFEVDLSYLALISNTSDFNYWEIPANKKHQNQIIELVENMVWHINKDKIPKELAMNQDDVKEIYHDIKDDFLLLTGPAKDKSVEIAKSYNKAKRQENIWNAKKNEALDSMAVLLENYQEIRDENQKIATWSTRKGSERLKPLSKIKKENVTLYNYLKKQELISVGKESRNVSIKFKEEI